MTINRITATVWLVVAMSWFAPSIHAQTPAPTASATQAVGTPPPSALGTLIATQAQTTPAPTPATTATATTTAPTPLPPTLAPVTNSPTRSLGREECNICGEGTQNLIGEPTAVVNFPDPDEPDVMRRFPCSELQNLVNVRNVYKREDVCSYIFEYTYATCRCTTPEGDLLSDVLVPTVAPGEGDDQSNPTDGSGGDGDGGDNGGDGGDSGGTAVVKSQLVVAIMSAAAILIGAMV